jgi:hypothetical protein
MSYVAAAYVVTIAVLAAYVGTLWARQRDLHRRAGPG